MYLLPHHCNSLHDKKQPINRDQSIAQLSKQSSWDIIIIGGGATGLGIAVDAASRGFTTLLLEQFDFAKGTSSRSTKLVHGGVRYLAQGNIQLVFSALRERGILLRNAPHLVQKQSFLIPCYSFFEKLKYYIGLKLYDWLAGPLSFGSSKYINKKIFNQRIPGLQTRKLQGGVEYFDGRFDDTRLAINLAQTAAAHGAVVLNYCKVTALKKENGKVSGVTVVDLESNREYHVAGKSVVNATGIFVDDVLRMDHPESKPIVKWSQGTHLVVDHSFLKSDSALLVPQTPDGRVLFAVPWHGHVLVGTTDIPLEQHSSEPIALEEEVEFILDTIKDYLLHPPKKKDILSIFAGLRPLAVTGTGVKATKEISRDHKIIFSDTGLITITGGKWTTYRKMAEDVINTLIKNKVLPNVACHTKKIKLHGYTILDDNSSLAVYGSDAEDIRELMEDNKDYSKKLVDSMPYTEAEVIWAIRNEMARTVEDVLARRLRVLFINARAAIEAAPRVAELLQQELQKTDEWKNDQLTEFHKLALQYRVKGLS